MRRGRADETGTDLVSKDRGIAAPDNNMVIVSVNQSDSGGVGDGNLTRVTAYPSATDTRVTSFGYDFRDGRTSTDGEIDVYEAYPYDNLDRLTLTERRDTANGGTLIGKKTEGGQEYFYRRRQKGVRETERGQESFYSERS